MSSKNHTIAFGTYRLPREETSELVKFAIANGCSRIDTAQLYGNEMEAYEAVVSMRRNGFNSHLTTKIHRNVMKEAPRDPLAVYNSIKIKPDAILIHMPLKPSEILATYDQLLKLKSSRHFDVGVSNFTVEDMLRLPSLPSINQIEVTPFNSCTETVEFCRKNGIEIQAHSALTKGIALQDNTIKMKACQYSLTPAQLLLNWSLNQGYVPIFSSKNKEHIIECLRTPDFVVNLPELHSEFRTHIQYKV